MGQVEILEMLATDHDSYRIRRDQLVGLMSLLLVFDQSRGVSPKDLLIFIGEFWESMKIRVDFKTHDVLLGVLKEIFDNDARFVGIEIEYNNVDLRNHRIESNNHVVIGLNGMVRVIENGGHMMVEYFAN